MISKILNIWCFKNQFSAAFIIKKVLKITYTVLLHENCKVNLLRNDKGQREDIGYRILAIYGWIYGDYMQPQLGVQERCGWI
jgi:hypothetical protein